MLIVVVVVKVKCVIVVFENGSLVLMLWFVNVYGVLDVWYLGV